MAAPVAEPRFFNRETIKKINVLTGRLVKRREEWMKAQPSVYAQTSVSFTKSWKETEGQHPDLRWSKAFVQIMKDSPIVIRDGELIVGSQSKDLRPADMITALAPDVVMRQVKDGRIQIRSSHRLSAPAEGEEAERLREDAEYWLDHLPPNYEIIALREELGEGHLDLLEDKSGVLLNHSPQRGVKPPITFPDISLRLIKEGLNGVIARARAEMEKVDNSSFNLPSVTDLAYDKWVLWRSVIMSCEAVIEWAKKHAELARSMAKTESNPVRKKELETIADNCEWVPANPPQNFWQAVQFAQFMHLAVRKEHPSKRHNTIARIDQYLYPWYEKDVKEGKITKHETAELLGCLWLKIREEDALDFWEEYKEIGEGGRRVVEGIEAFPAPSTFLCHATIGGQTAQGKDATNDLSWLVLRVMGEMKFPEPSVYIRVHDGMNKEFLQYALELNRDHTSGNPVFVNDKLGTARYLDRGVALEDAVEWIASGCVSNNLGGIEIHPGGFEHLNVGKIFELTLHNGFDPKLGKQLGLKTGDAAKFTFEQLKEAYYKQVDYFTQVMRKDYVVRISTQIKHYPASGLASAMYPDCIKNGRDARKGGGRYPVLGQVWMGAVSGFTDVADALAAIKYLVFDKKQVTMAELLDALRNDWRGREDIRQMCLKAPKFGNDDPYVDDIFEEIWLKIEGIMLSRPDPFTGLKPFLFRGAGTGFMIQGRVTGALPNGRYAYEPLNDGATSPMPGMDVKGPTAVVNSATRADTWPWISMVHNMKLDKALLNTPERLDQILTLTKRFFDQGGFIIQYNIVGVEDLIDARKHPEKWPNLVVRVAGFSAYFVDLPLIIQDEVISRTLHGM